MKMVVLLRRQNRQIYNSFIYFAIFPLLLQIAIWGTKENVKNGPNFPDFGPKNMPVWQTHYI